MNDLVSATQVDDHVFLVGRPPIGEFFGFIRTMAIDGQSADLGQLTAEWREANDHLAALEKSEAGIADGVTSKEIPTELSALCNQVRADAVFQGTFRYVPTEFAIVELDRLVVFQKFINLGYIQTLKTSLPASPTAIDLARLAFGIGRQTPGVRIMQNATNIYSFISASNDFRFLEGMLLSPQQVAATTTTGSPTAYIVLAVGFGANLLTALSVEGRLILNNGSHRAYCLRDLGITEAPCLIQRITRREELDVVASGDVQQNPDRYLKSVRPPLLKDYFDPKLRKIVSVPRKNRLVRVQFGFEQSEVPAG